MSPTRTTDRPHRLGAVLVGLALLAGAACSSSDEDEGAAAGAAEAEATPTTAAAASSAIEDLAGRWAHVDVVAYEDATMKTLIISTGFADLEVRDGELWNQMVFCHADTANDLGTEVTFSDAATQAILPIATPVEVAGEEGALRIERPLTPTPIGVDMDPETEEFPTDPDDPRIIDADGDGNPGVTAVLQVSPDLGGELYLVRLENFAYDVTQVSEDRFEGTIDDTSLQLIVGASDPLFETQSSWEQIDDPERNPVIWVRVEEDWDCDRLAEERAALFPPNPEADW